MTTYRAPLRDMQFVLQDLLNIEKHYQSLPACEEVNQDLIDAVLGEASKFSEEIAWQRAGVDPHRINTLPVIQHEERVWFSPNYEETLFNAIQELAQHILLFSLLLPAAALAREKERGTVETDEDGETVRRRERADVRGVDKLAMLWDTEKLHRHMDRD